MPRVRLIFFSRQHLVIKMTPEEKRLNLDFSPVVSLEKQITF